MEIKITQFFNEASPRDYSASVAELGQDAGKITWGHAVEDSAEYMFLDDDDKREAFRNFISGFGAWTHEEVWGWDDIHLNALFIQFVSGAMREGDLDCEYPDWDIYEFKVEAGTVSGRLFRSCGDVFFELG